MNFVAARTVALGLLMTATAGPLVLCLSVGTGCESGQDVIQCDRSEYLPIVEEEQIKAESCMGDGADPMKITRMSVYIVDGDPAHGYRMWSEQRKQWIGAFSVPVGQQHSMTVAVDPRDPGCTVNRQRFQWEWKNSLTHGADGRTSPPYPTWMDWGYRP